MVNHTENDALLELPPEAILERCGPVKGPVPQTFTDVEKPVIVFMFFVVEVILISRPTTTDAKNVQEPLSFSPVSVMIVGICFSDGTARERVLPQEVGGICQP